MKDRKLKIALFLGGLVILAMVLSQCAPAPTPAPPPTAKPPEPTKPVAATVPTPEATGLAEYVPPEGGLVAEIKKRGVLKNGVECQNPPGEYFDTASGKCTGYSIELAQKIADSLGVKLEVIDTAWSGVIPSLYTKNFDMILSSMTITEARKKAVNFSMPVGCDQVTWIVKKDDNRISKPEDLNGMIVATQLNSAAETQAKDLETQYNIKYKELKSFDHFDGAYLAVKTGQADIATSTAWNNIPLFKAEKDVFKVAFSLPIYNYVGIAIRKQDTDLLKVVNDILNQLMASGEMANLQYKYYGYGMDCGDPGPNTPPGWKPPQ
jgi:polar amino acid transport system substrate-binding protein